MSEDVDQHAVAEDNVREARLRAASSWRRTDLPEGEVEVTTRILRLDGSVAVYRVTQPPDGDCRVEEVLP